MLLSVSSPATISGGKLLLIACFSGVCLFNGVRHYRGRGTWLLSLLPSEASFFGPAWYGACGLMVVVADLAGQVSVVLEGLLAIPAVVLLAVALMSLVWLPSRLLPEWYRDRRRDCRSHARPMR